MYREDNEIAKESNETIMNERVMTKSMLFLVDLGLRKLRRLTFPFFHLGTVYKL
jgi:hypothetical protein